MSTAAGNDSHSIVLKTSVYVWLCMGTFLRFDRTAIDLNDGDRLQLSNRASIALSRSVSQRSILPPLISPSARLGGALLHRYALQSVMVGLV